MEQRKTSGQLRAARALVGFSQERLAKAAGLSSMTVKRAESSGQSLPSSTALGKIIKTLEKEGVQFIEENGGGPGVRLRKGTYK